MASIESGARHHDGSLQRTGAARRFWPPLAIALALATAVALLQMASSVSAPVASLAVSETASEALIRQFYRELDRALTTGETTRLAPFIAPDFASHASNDSSPLDRDGLLDAISSAHYAWTGRTIRVTSIVASDDLVLARVEVESHLEKDAVGFPEPRLPFAAVNVFETTNGQISTFWDGMRTRQVPCAAKQPWAAAGQSVSADAPALTGSPTAIMERWRFNAANDFVSPPAFIDDLILEYGRSGELLAMDAETGILRWTMPISGRANLPPVGANGLIVAAGDDGLIAIDTETGIARWQQQFSMKAPAAMVRSGGIVIAVKQFDAALGLIDGAILAETEGDADLQAFDLISGEPCWSTHVSGAGLHTIDPQTGEQIRPRLDLRDGDLRWRPVLSSTEGGATLLLTLRETIRSLDLFTGEEQWTAPLTSSSRAFVQRVSDRVVVVQAVSPLQTNNGVTWTADLQVFDAADGTLVWRTTIDTALGVAAAGNDDLICVALKSGGVAIFSTATGVPIATLPTSGSIAGIDLEGDRITVADVRGGVAVYDLANLLMLQTFDSPKMGPGGPIPSGA